MDLLKRVVPEGGLKYKSEALLKDMIDISVNNIYKLQYDAHYAGGAEMIDILYEHSYTPTQKAIVDDLRKIWKERHEKTVH